MSDLRAINGKQHLGTPRRPSVLPVSMGRAVLDALADAALAAGVTPSEWAEEAIVARLARMGLAPADDAAGPATPPGTPQGGPTAGEPEDSRPDGDDFSAGILGRQAGKP